MNEKLTLVTVLGRFTLALDKIPTNFEQKTQDVVEICFKATPFLTHVL